MTEAQLPIAISGAGLSAAPPTNAPLGRELSQAFLLALINGAGGRAPFTAEGFWATDIWRSHLEPWPLETLVGQIHAEIGPRAFNPLKTIPTGPPNEAHRLAAVLLHTDGAPRLHLTLNFDEHVETAYRQLGSLDEPESLTPVDGDRLTRLAEEDWYALRKPAVLHLHGAIRAGGEGFTFPGLVATLDSISWPLPEPIRRIVRRLADHRVLVTGYRGQDTDLWPELLRWRGGSDSPHREWNLISEPESALREGAGPLGFKFTTDGAAGALARALGLRPTPDQRRQPADLVAASSLLDLSPAEAAFLLAWVLQDAAGSGRRLSEHMLRSAVPEGANERLRWLWLYKRGTVLRQLDATRDALAAFRAAYDAASNDGERMDVRVERCSVRQDSAIDGGLRTKARWIAEVIGALAFGRCRAVRDGYATPRSNVMLATTTTALAEALLPHDRARLITRGLATLGHRYAGTSTSAENPHSRIGAHLRLAESAAIAALAGARGADMAAARVDLASAADLAQFIGHSATRCRVSFAQSLLLAAGGDFAAADEELAALERRLWDDAYLSALRSASARRRGLARINSGGGAARRSGKPSS